MTEIIPKLPVLNMTKVRVLGRVRTHHWLRYNWTFFSLLTTLSHPLPHAATPPTPPPPYNSVTAHSRPLMYLKKLYARRKDYRITRFNPDEGETTVRRRGVKGSYIGQPAARHTLTTPTSLLSPVLPIVQFLILCVYTVLKGKKKEGGVRKHKR